MKKSLFLLLLLLTAFTGSAQHSVLNGDMNHDGKLSIEDVTALTNIILGKANPEVITSECDLSYEELRPATYATLMNGSSFNFALKKLVDPSVKYSSDKDDTILKITFAQGIAPEGTLVSTASSEREARAVYDASTQEVTIYVDASELQFPASCTSMFGNFQAVTSIDWSAFDGHLDTSNVTDMGGMFYECYSLTALDLSTFDTSNVTDMIYMFRDCSSLTTLDLSNFNTSNVTNMYYMFGSCSSLTTLDVSKFDTSNVTDMAYMFYLCSSLTTLDVSKFNTSNVTDMTFMFGSCSSLTTLYISNFNTSNVTSMSAMFGGCSSLTTLDLSKFDTSNVVFMSEMFNNCSSLTTLDVSKFNTSNVMSMRSMFDGCSSLTTLNVSNFNTSNVTNMRSMFSSCYILSDLNLGKDFVISTGCNKAYLALYLAYKITKCTITCTESTQAQLQNSETGLNTSKISWVIL